ncbi:MAG TPA: RIO1 family regulatory kinase/ATPase [Polyangiaceae bacterium]|nr:RIO1 family regulatory kinase/ATPase [Polyangiaceae bacterium]
MAEGVVSEVITRLKSGKEADVYMVRYGGNVVAAKVYKDRAQRSFKNNSSYKEGRSVRNSRSQRAIDKGSKFGKGADEDAWKASEVATLYRLHAAGVRVPTPILFLEGVLLMEVVRGRDGEAASRLIDVELTAEEARATYLDMLSQLVRILSCDLIHGDLSPYNVLWGAAGATIIDFPQTISAAHNNGSEAFFLRDARNILDHFVAVDPTLKARSGDAREIWRAYLRRELTPDFVPSGRPEPVQKAPRTVEPRRVQAAADDRGPRAPQQRSPQQPQQRGPQQSQQRGPQQSQQRSPQQPQQRSPQQPQQRGPQQAERAPNHDRPRPSGGQRRPRVPEVIVLTRRSSKG